MAGSDGDAETYPMPEATATTAATTIGDRGYAANREEAIAMHGGTGAYAKSLNHLGTNGE
jgi:hypothetical protein